MRRESHPESHFEFHSELSNSQKFEVILKLFGTAKARENFLNLCQEYNNIRRTHRAQAVLIDQENYRKARSKDFSPGQRAAVHNQIMETLKRLSMQKLTDQQRSVLFEMADRDVTAKIVHDYLAEQDQIIEDDDDEFKNSRHNSPSDTAYFHSLGKGG